MSRWGVEGRGAAGLPPPDVQGGGHAGGQAAARCRDGEVMAVSGSVAGVAGLAFLVALALVPLLVRFAIGRDLLDVPNSRSSHDIPTPRLGGLAVIAGGWAGA